MQYNFLAYSTSIMSRAPAFDRVVDARSAQDAARKLATALDGVVGKSGLTVVVPDLGFVCDENHAMARPAP